MNPDFIIKLSLWVCKTKVGVSKIDGLDPDTLDMVKASFSIEDKEKRFRFFEETFLLAYISMDINLGMLFFILSNIEIDFVDCHIY